MRRITHITCSEWKETSLNAVGSWDCQAQGPPGDRRVRSWGCWAGPEMGRDPWPKISSLWASPERLRGKPGPPEPLSLKRVPGSCVQTGVRYLGVGRSRELP